MVEKITIIIPMYKRRKYLHRILDYYSNTDFNIMVADSSDEKFMFCKDYKNVKYFHYKNRTYSKKMQEIIKKVKTKYVVICADDDFIIPDSIKKCVKFLNENSDYASAQGLYISFINESKKIIHIPAYLSSIGKDINSNDSLKRLKQLLSSYLQLFYSVHRTENLNVVFKISEKKIKNLNLIELLIAIVSCINGKHKVLPIFYGAREQIEGSAGRLTDKLNNIISKGAYKEEYEYFIKSASDYLSAKEGLAKKNSMMYIREAIEIYLKGIKSSKKSPKSHLFNLYFTLIPESFKRFVTKLHIFLLRLSTKKIKGFPLFERKYKKELEKIDYFVKKYNIK